jgi:hypothetical protein
VVGTINNNVVYDGTVQEWWVDCILMHSHTIYPLYCRWVDPLDNICTCGSVVEGQLMRALGRDPSLLRLRLQLPQLPDGNRGGGSTEGASMDQLMQVQYYGACSIEGVDGSADAGTVLWCMHYRGCRWIS